MAATVKKQIHLYATDGAGAAPNMDTVQIAGSMGLPIAGTPMVLAADGYWDLVATDGVKCHGFLAETILTEKSEGDKVRIVRAKLGTRYIMRCDSDDTDSAVVQADIGDSFGVTVGAASGAVGYSTLNLGETGNPLFKLVDIMYNKDPLTYALADDPGVAIVELVETALASS